MVSALRANQVQILFIGPALELHDHIDVRVRVDTLEIGREFRLLCILVVGGREGGLLDGLARSGRWPLFSDLRAVLRRFSCLGSGHQNAAQALQEAVGRRRRRLRLLRRGVSREGCRHIPRGRTRIQRVVPEVANRGEQEDPKHQEACPPNRALGQTRGGGLILSAIVVSYLFLFSFIRRHRSSPYAIVVPRPFTSCRRLWRRSWHPSWSCCPR